MAIITISRGTFSGGQLLAECVTEKLGYRCVSREVLVEAAREYGVEEEELSKTLREKPGVVERLTAERAHYLAYIRAALCKDVKDDNLVYHGLAGHLLLKGVPHVLKVKVIANMEFRIKNAMNRNNMTREEAMRYIAKVDDERAKWTRFLYHVDWNDPALYDLVVNLDHLSVPGACELVCISLSLEEFKTTSEWQKIRDDLAFAANVRALIASDKNIGALDAGVEIEADNGIVTIGGTVASLEYADRLKEMVSKMPDVKRVESKMKVWPLW